MFWDYPGGGCMRRFICAAVVTLCAFSVAMAEEFIGSITKVEDGKVTFKKFAFKKGEKGKAEERTLTLAKGVKIYKDSKFNKEDKKFEGGEEITAAALTDLVKKAEKGQFARFVTEGEGDKEKITEIRTFNFGGFG